MQRRSPYLARPRRTAPGALPPQTAHTAQTVQAVPTPCDSVPCQVDPPLLEALLHLERRFEETFARDTVREQHLTKLHDELQTHKRGLLQTLERPYIMGLIQLHDATGRTVEHLLSAPERTFSAKEAAQLLEDFRGDVELVMQHNALEPFQEPGTTFAPARQTSLKTVPVNDPALAGQVAQRLRPGFEQQGVVVQKERVTVYTHTGHIGHTVEKGTQQP